MIRKPGDRWAAAWTSKRAEGSTQRCAAIVWLDFGQWSMVFAVLATAPWYVAALVSWGIALFEYLLQVPANRIGYTQFNVGQLKILQEVITLSVFVPFAVF